MGVVFAAVLVALLPFRRWGDPLGPAVAESDGLRLDLEVGGEEGALNQLLHLRTHQSQLVERQQLQQRHIALPQHNTRRDETHRGEEESEETGERAVGLDCAVWRVSDCSGGFWY